jgi:DNA-binding transcriptional regulator YbjK
MDKDRKTLIADAAIALLASAGAKGLTHRAVDAEAGLPMGSTSFYCRTRADLLTLTLLRHAALDMEDLLADQARMATPGFGLNDFVELLADRVADWLSSAKRARLVARFELFLIASREPELATIATQQRERFRLATEAALTRAGVADAAAAAPLLLVTVDGLLIDQIGASGPGPTRDRQKAMFRMVLGSESP